MSSGFNPMSMFKPTGNLIVQEKLKNKDTLIQDLLIQQSFLTEFRKPDHELLEKYMTYFKYKKLVQYITIIGDPNDKNKSFKFPFVAAQILSIDNQHTYKLFVSESPIIQQVVTQQQIQIEKENQSDQSFVSNKSSQSVISDQQQAQNQNNYEVLEQVNIQNLPSINIQKNASQINEDDFPSVQQVKRVKVKQRIKVTKKIQFKPLIEDLFLFFQEPLNHILSGYVCKILQSLLSKKKQNFKYFIRNRKQSLIKHIQSRSVEDLIVRICTIQNELYIQDQLQFIHFLVQKLINSQEIQEIESIGFLLSQIFKKINLQSKQSLTAKKMTTQILKSLILRKLSNHVIKCVERQKQIIEEQNQKNYKQEFKILQFRSKQLLKIIEEFVQMITLAKTLQLESFLLFDDELNSLADSLCNKMILICKQEISISGCASLKISLMKILFQMIYQNLAFCQQILSEKENLFNQLLKIVKKYPNNNILHNQIFKILQLIIMSIESINKTKTVFVTAKLAKNLLQSNNQNSFLKFIQSTLLNKNLTKNTYSGHITKLVLIIDSIEIKHSESLKIFKQSSQWSNINNQFLTSHKNLMKINLGSYSKKKQTCASINFQKQQILKKYQHFLNGAKFMELDMFQNFQPTDSDSSHDQKQIKQRQKQIEEMEQQQCELNLKLSVENSQNLEGQTPKDIN